MSLEELKVAFTQLPPDEQDALARWLEGYLAGAEDRQDGADAPVVVRVPPLAYFKSMFLLAWMAFRHPFTDTYIDVTQGKVVKP